MSNKDLNSASYRSSINRLKYYVYSRCCSKQIIGLYVNQINLYKIIEYISKTLSSNQQISPLDLRQTASVYEYDVNYMESILEYNQVLRSLPTSTPTDDAISQTEASSLWRYIDNISNIHVSHDTFVRYLTMINQFYFEKKRLIMDNVTVKKKYDIITYQDRCQTQR